MAKTYINTKFIISNNQTEYPVEQIWVSFAGNFTNTHQEQTIGSSKITDFTSTWRSFNIEELQAIITDIECIENTFQYTFSLNSFSGRIYINYGLVALTTPPNPGAPGDSPYIVFEPTVDGLTLAAPTPSASNMDLSYVDGISAQAATMVRSSITGFALKATSVNPVTATNDIMENVKGLVPTAAKVMNGNKLVRIMSSAASPSSYHDWDSLITILQGNTKNTPLNVSSYTSPLTGLPANYALNGALFGYSGAPVISGQLEGFDKKQDYSMEAVFSTDINPTNNLILNNNGIKKGVSGVIISGSGTVSGDFSIYITQAILNAGTGIYGNNPEYVVYYMNSKKKEEAYTTSGIVNDLGGRIVGDLMAGIVFGWSASTVNIVAHASATGTGLYQIPFSGTTVGELSTGELFFLLSLAGSQGKLQEWIGHSLDNTTTNYDPYLYAIARNSEAYGSGFTDRLEGYSNPDTYWYTANPPVIPGETGNYEKVGFVNLFLGNSETAQMDILLTNNSSESLVLMNSGINSSNGLSSLGLPATIPAGSTAGGYSIPVSVSPYEAIWKYSPDGGNTMLIFTCSLSGPHGISITPSVTGSNSVKWSLSESPSLQDGIWVVRFTYS